MVQQVFVVVQETGRRTADQQTDGNHSQKQRPENRPHTDRGASLHRNQRIGEEE
jgi:hypothetical protein